LQLATIREAFWQHLPHPSNWMNDYEDLFSKAEEDSLNAVISRIEQRTALEIAIVTLDSSFVADSDFDSLAAHMHNVWGIGKKDLGNGLLLFVSASRRRLRISSGRGIRAILPDAALEAIIAQHFLPAYKEGRYFAGTLAGIEAIVAALK